MVVFSLCLSFIFALIIGCLVWQVLYNREQIIKLQGKIITLELANQNSMDEFKNEKGLYTSIKRNKNE